jgi:hypothetical protein
MAVKKFHAIRDGGVLSRPSVVASWRICLGRDAVLHRDRLQGATQVPVHRAGLAAGVVGGAAPADDVVGHGDQDVLRRVVPLGQHSQLGVEQLQQRVEPVLPGPDLQDLPQLGLA